MARTEVYSGQIKDEQVKRADLNVTGSGDAVARRIIAGSRINIGSTGADTGTGDVTINVDDAFLLNSGDVGTGSYDFGGADSFELPNSATPTVNADGEIAVDSSVTDFSHGILKYYGGEELAVVALPVAELTSPTDGHVVAYNATNDEFELVAGELTGYSKSITFESPTDAEDISIFFTNEAITITEMRAVLVGSDTPSVTWTIRHSTDRSAAGNEVVTSGTTTTSTTSGSDVTSFNDATIPADSFVWLETTAQSGTVGQMHITLYYTID